MDKIENRAVIKFFVKKGLKAMKIHSEMVNVLGASAPSRAMVCKWAAEFQRGRQSLYDDPRSGRPTSVTTEEMINSVHNMIKIDGQLTLSEIAAAMDVSSERVLHILKKELSLRKVCSRWVPNVLSINQKQQRIEFSTQNLNLFRKNEIDFKRRFVTTDETWVYHYSPEPGKETKAGCSVPKQPKWSKSTKKIMALVFWDGKGILLIDYLQTGEMITEKYYLNLLERLDERILRKRPALAKKKIYFHVPADRGVLVKDKLKVLHYELLQHPPYSPDLTPSVFHLFVNLKKFLDGKRFSSDEEVILAVNDYFDGLPESHFKDGINKLGNRWEKCIELNGEYTEE
ncbi:histone-lysine N-methyltransferase SETMAR-like [Glossina fuscipes fuscipes]